MTVIEAPVTVGGGERERPFGIDELFFSATDRKGIIRHGNPVFVRVSGFSPDELYGRPHNLVRHPGTPRVVFRLLWDTLGAGRPIAAYVKNRAKDGSYYWVVATAVPSGDGYLSIRLKPTSHWFATVQKIYAELARVEADVEASGGSRSRAMDASGERLGEILTGAGFADYDAFMREFLPAEIASRQAQLGGPPVAPLGGRGGRSDRIGATAESELVTLGSHLDAIFANVDTYATLNNELSTKTTLLFDLADGLSTFSLNGMIAASRLSGSGVTLAAVADGLRQTGATTAELVRDLTSIATETLDVLGHLSFDVSLSKLQSEMARFFVVERSQHPDDLGAADQLREIVSVLVDQVDSTATSLDRLRTQLAAIDEMVGRLRGSLRTLRFLEVKGRIESTRVESAEAFEALFSQIRLLVTAVDDDVAMLAKLAQDAHDHDAMGHPAELRAVVGHLAELTGGAVGAGRGAGAQMRTRP